MKRFDLQQGGETLTYEDRTIMFSRHIIFKGNCDDYVTKRAYIISGETLEVVLEFVKRECLLKIMFLTFKNGYTKAKVFT